MAKNKKLKLNEMSIANGKVWDQGEIELQGKNIYSSLSLAEYEEKLNNMDMFDLQIHAVNSLVPVKEKRETLISNLIKEFKLRKTNR